MNGGKQTWQNPKMSICPRTSGLDVVLADWPFGSKLPTLTLSKPHRCCKAAPTDILAINRAFGA